MANRFGRTQRKAGNVAAQKRRLRLLPKADRLSLLAGTALITGAVLWPTHPAFAVCVPTGANLLNCTGAAENAPQTLNPDNTWEVNIGSGLPETDPDADGSIDIPNGVGGSALTITGNGNSGSIEVYDGSFIRTADPLDDAVNLNNFGFVDIFLYGGDGADGDDDGFIRGTFNGLNITTGTELNVFNQGEVVGTGADGLFAGTIGSGGVDIFNNGEDGFGGGLFAGLNNGINIQNVVDFGDVYIENSGFWTDDLLPGDVPVGGLAFRDGGLIFGQNGNGINIESFEDSIWINNLNTLDSDASPFTNTTDLTMPVINGSGGPVAVNAGIWGGQYGVYIDGETTGFEDGRFVGIANFNGLIVGERNDGIYITNLEGEDGFFGGFEDAVQIYNGNGGIITGTETASGIHAEYIGGRIYIDNGGVAAGSLPSFLGEDFGAEAVGEEGTGFTGGYIVGDADGIELHNVEDGVWIDNGRGGEIWGTGASGEGGTGIEISDVFASYEDLFEVNGGDVVIANGFLSNSEDAYVGNYYLNPFMPITDGGFIFGEDRAIAITAAPVAGIFNGEGGFILGQGSFFDGTPVIYLNTSNYGDIGEDFIPAPDGPEEINWNQASSQVVNYGLMSSYYLPHLTIGSFEDIGPGEVPDWDFDDEAFRDDLAGLQNYIWNGGSKSQLDGFLFPEAGSFLTDGYEDAAAAHLLVSIDPEELDNIGFFNDIPDRIGPSGAVDLYNFDVMFGRISATGINADFADIFQPFQDTPVGNLVQNEGIWMVKDDLEAEFLGPYPPLGWAAYLDSGEDFGPEAGEEGDDLIVNNGLIQTAFGEGEDRATFFMDNFVQGSSYLKYEEAYLFGEDFVPPIVVKSGTLSMVDGYAGDTVNILGNFWGAEDFYFGQFGNEDAAEGFKSYVAMDVFLQDQQAYDLATSGDYPSDFLYIGEDAGGTTGMIFRKLNEMPVPVDEFDLPNQIQVVNIEGDTVGEDCVGEWCKDGDVFFIASQSDGYFESTDGTGFISDGLKSWGMTMYQGGIGEDVYLETVSEFASPGAFNAPKLATGVLNIADDIFDVVSDHNSGFQFRTGGGGGADLPMEAPVYDAPAASNGTQTGLWAKVTGTKWDRDDEVTDGGFTFETDYNQNIYTILGGADFKWDPNSPFRIGLFGGYVNSSMDFDLGDGNVDYEGGVVGTYLAYNNGAFYADATVKAEFLSNDYSFDGVDVSADSTSVGVSANTGYRFAMGGAFVEPLASFRYVHAAVDGFDSTDGTVDYDDPQSLKAGAGARVGTTFATGGATTQVSLLGRVWNEFDGESEVTVDNGIDTFTYTDDISGLYGEVEGEILVTSSDGTLSGFVSANGKFGDDFTSYGAKAGVRKGF